MWTLIKVAFTVLTELHASFAREIMTYRHGNRQFSIIPDITEFHKQLNTVKLVTASKETPFMSLWNWRKHVSNLILKPLPEHVNNIVPSSTFQILQWTSWKLLIKFGEWKINQLNLPGKLDKIMRIFFIRRGTKEDEKSSWKALNNV